MNSKNKVTSQQPLPPQEFAKQVIRWQLKHGRHDLPWQKNNQPYHVLVSELMLQQTQVSTVIPYFHNWLNKFPDINTLAKASEDQVLHAWQGLGYYSRARNLHRAAQYIVSEYKGALPDSPDLLREIPGVGPYTAGAITAFAFDKPAAIVDGNVKRLFARYFGIVGDLSTSALAKELWQLAEKYTPLQDNRVYAQGLLDLGATLCKARTPLCAQCPLHESCNALATDRIDQLPTRKKKAALPTRQGCFVLAVADNCIYLQQRAGTGIWPRLWCLPEVDQVPEQLSQHGSFKHTFSHYRLEATVYQAAPELVTDILGQPGVQRVTFEQIEQLGLPAPIRKYLDTHFEFAT